MKTEYITVSMVPSGVPPVVHLSQYDVGRPVGFIADTDLDDYTVTVEATRTDGTAITVAVTTDDNVGAFATTATMTNEVDTYGAQIVLTASGIRAASIPIKIVVVQAAMDENAETIEEDASLYEQFTSAMQSAIAEVRAASSTLHSAVNTERTARIEQDGLLQSQIDELVAPSGSAPSEAEVQNARIGVNGLTYDSLGNAIRGQVSDLETAFETVGYEMLSTRVRAYEVNVAGLVFATSTGYDNHFVNVVGGDVVTINAGAYPVYIAFFQVDPLVNVGNTISYSATYSSKINLPSWSSNTYTVPDDTVCLYIQHLNASVDVTPAGVLINGFNIKQSVAESIEGNYWSGKKIVWFGTSIPAGVVNAGDSGGNGAYPTRVGERLGATIFNESLGSSEVRGGTHGSYVSTDDPNGYGGVSAPGLFLSMSLSSSEKEAIYNAWDSKWGNIITWYADDLNFDNIQTYYNSSWDVLLAKYLSGGSVGQCDLYVFDHGFNDQAQGEGYTELADMPSDMTDRTYWIGAMGFLFTKILQDNPKARILIIGHYSSNQNSGTSADTSALCEAQTALAEYWNFPIIKTWEKMGFSFTEFTYDGSTTSAAAQWMPDGIHPSSDSTGAALEHYAEVLYSFMKDVR